MFENREKYYFNTQLKIIFAVGIKNNLMRKQLLKILLLLVVTSCIPKKDLVYFQGESSFSADADKILNEPYKLQVNDILDIRIKAADEKLVALFSQSNQQSSLANQITEENVYFNSYSVDLEGNIRIPYLKEINVLGYTIKEVQEKLEKEFESYFKNPDDIFIIVKLAGIRFTILGEVATPGTSVLFQNQVSIVEALANAGDITITGNRKKVTIIRKNAEGTTKYSIDLTNIASINSDYYFIQSNDVIYVEPLKQKSWGTGTTGSETFTTLISVFSLVTTTILLIRSFN